VRLVARPAAYLRQPPRRWRDQPAARPVSHRGELVKLWKRTRRVELRAVTGPDYGASGTMSWFGVMRIAGDGVGDPLEVLACWTGRPMTHKPLRGRDQDTTRSTHPTATSSFFLVDDGASMRPDASPNGDPDLFFRGSMLESEVGSKTLGMASFYLRAVC